MFQLVLLSFFDYFFVIHSIGVSSMYSWWFFAAYNLVAISAVIMSIVLRHIDDVKVLPSTVSMITVLISFLFSTISIIDYQNLKFVIISAFSMVIISTVMEAIMYLIQHYRYKHTKTEVELQQSDLGEYAEDDVVVEDKVKIKSSALLLLMTYVTDMKKWDNLDSMPFLEELIRVVTDCRQYTYEELRSIEEEIKVQTNALKTYTNNNSVERATSTANRIVILLDQREEEIDKIENVL